MAKAVFSGSPQLTLQERAKIEIEKRKRLEAGEQSTYSTFKKLYYNDPVGFARDCVMWGKNDDGLTGYQREAMKDLIQQGRYCMRGPHGLGKTMVASLVILWFALTRDDEPEDWKIPTTASAWRQLTKFLWPEIHKWARRLRWNVIGRQPFDTRSELLGLNLKLTSGEAFAMASDDYTTLEGAHADRLLYLFDESKTIPGATWDAAEGAFSVGDCLWLSISTPGEPQGRFYDIHKRKPGYEDWKVRHVTKEEAIAAGRMNEKWAEQRKRQWGEQSAVFQNRVEGNFAASDKDSIIPLSAIERSNERWLEKKENGLLPDPDRLGIDVGRGTDPSVFADGTVYTLTNIEEFNKDDTMEIAGHASSRLRGNAMLIAIVDMIGVGAGVFDRLREQDEIADRVRSFIASGGTDKQDESDELGFVDCRSALWWMGREKLIRDEWDIPPNDTLTGELTAPKWRMMSNGRIKVESKDDVFKRIGRSTNYADASLQTLWDEDVGDWGDFQELGSVNEFVSRWA